MSFKNGPRLNLTCMVVGGKGQAQRVGHTYTHTYMLLADLLPGWLEDAHAPGRGQRDRPPTRHTDTHTHCTAFAHICSSADNQHNSAKDDVGGEEPATKRLSKGHADSAIATLQPKEVQCVCMCVCVCVCVRMCT
jgi:hypothetical protein